jgi:hypothetical protein
MKHRKCTEKKTIKLIPHKSNKAFAFTICTNRKSAGRRTNCFFFVSTHKNLSSPTQMGKCLKPLFERELILQKLWVEYKNFLSVFCIYKSVMASQNLHYRQHSCLERIFLCSNIRQKRMFGIQKKNYLNFILTIYFPYKFYLQLV